jgi:glycosyltransferase involved in cell wall biosynthesis
MLRIAPPFEAVPPAGSGGTERGIATLTEELVRRGHNVMLFASGDSRTSARLVAIMSRAIWLQDGGDAALAIHGHPLDELSRRAEEFDVIHSHAEWLPFAMARQRPRPPLLTTAHVRLDVPAYEQLFQHFHASPLVSISHAQREPLPQANGVATIHGGVRLDDYPFAPRPGEYLAFVGRISPDKGVATAIRVARKTGRPIRLAARMPLDQPHNPEAQGDWQYYEAEVEPLLREPGVEYVGESWTMRPRRLC